MVLNRIRFNEAKVDLGKKFDKYFYISDINSQKVLDKYDNDVESLIKAALRGDNNAQLVLINAAKDRLLKIFWVNFIGKAISTKKLQQRINNDEFEEYCGLIYTEAFSKAAKSYKPEKLGDNTLGGWQYWLGQYAKAEAIKYNRDSMKSIDDSAMNPDEPWGGDSGSNNGKTHWEKIQFENDLGQNSSEYSGFDINWNKFCKDPLIVNNKKYDVANIFADMMDGMNVEELAKKYNTSKNTIRYGILQDIIGQKMREYDIEPMELIQANKRDFRYLNKLRKSGGR